MDTEEMNEPRSGQWPIDWLSARLLQRIDVSVTTHLVDAEHQLDGVRHREERRPSADELGEEGCLLTFK